MTNLIKLFGAVALVVGLSACGAFGGSNEQPQPDPNGGVNDTTNNDGGGDNDARSAPSSGYTADQYIRVLDADKI